MPNLLLAACLIQIAASLFSFFVSVRFFLAPSAGELAARLKELDARAGEIATRFSRVDAIEKSFGALLKGLEQTDKLGDRLKYDLLDRLASDAIAYAEQQAYTQQEKRGGTPWTWRDKSEAALHFAQLQLTALGLDSIDRAAMARQIEARLPGHPAKEG